MEFLRSRILKVVKAFTLAEVLITLTIIGVIAALTIPVLLQDIQTQNLRTQWKSAYSIVEQANKKALIDYGGDFTGVFQNRTDFRDKMKGYFSYTKECANGQSAGNCWPAITYDMPGVPGGWTDVPALVLNNGMFIRFYIDISNGTTCTGNELYSPGGECGAYEVDVNGFKGLNILGEDIFMMHVLKDRILPAGVSGSIYGCSSTGRVGCGAIYLRQ